MLSINTNLSSLIAQQSMKTSTNKLNQAIERMTTGFKINHAKDNAANYSISTNMTTKINSYMVAEDNVAMGLDMLATANGSLDQISDKLTRLRDLATQASNGTYGAQSLNAINQEANALVDEIERIYNNSEYNGIDLMKGKVTGTEQSKFIKDIDRRDTSKMTKLSSVDPTEKLELGTYSISTAEELAQLATMTNNGLIGENTEFVLANDIDLSGYSNWTPIGGYVTDINGGDVYSKSFQANFDGNGHVVSNLKVDRETEDFVGLFGYIVEGNVKNLGVENAIVKGNVRSGILSGHAQLGTFTNVYVEGEVQGVGFVGGLFGQANSTLTDSYADVKLDGNDYIGGLAGGISTKGSTYNCFSKGTAHARAGIAGGLFGQCSSEVKNCYTSVNLTVDTSYGGAIIGNLVNITLKDCYSNGTLSAPTGDIVGVYSNSSTENCSILSASDQVPFTITNNAQIFNSDTQLTLQVGTNSDSNSRISIDTGFVIDGISSLRGIGVNDLDYLSYIDRFLNNLSDRTTDIGAVQNRLESALDEISIQYENLVSSRSTIRDADIAEVSSEYIRQQILQQASATLLATANQSPSIALQLI